MVSVHGMNKHEFTAADECNCRNSPALISYTDIDTSKFYDLAKDIVWLIENFGTVRASQELENGYRDRYLSILKNKGIATSKGRVYQNEFIHVFRAFYGDRFLATIQCNIEDDFENNWLSSIVRKHRKSFHPLRHLLLIRYLTGDIEEFFNCVPKYIPFGEGPWPCLNTAAEHYGKLVVNNLTVTHCFDTKLPVGTFKCSCGFIYSRRGADKTQDDLYKIGRIKQFGTIWEDKLNELVQKEKLSMRETAKRLKVDAITVDKYVKLLGLNAVWISNKTKPIEDCKNEFLKPCNELEDYYRGRWLELKYEHPEALKTELREMNKATYAWLYRHDREWLNKNSPFRKLTGVQYSRINWVSRDRDVLAKVKQVVNEILNARSKPERITCRRLGKKIGLLALLEKHLDKMPKTKEYLEKVVESTEKYAIRRISWCANEMNKKGEELRGWKLARLAGLRPGYSVKVQHAINREIIHYSSKTINNTEGMSNARGYNFKSLEI